MDFNLINVGIADLGVSGSPDILRTILGSCVGVCLYDPIGRRGGLAHIMLPTYKERSTSPKKYADTAIPMLVEEIVKLGADSGKLTAKLIGGATMFNLGEKSIMGEIGRNNVDKARLVLKELGIEIVAEDVGGDYGRTVDFYLETGKIKIKSMGREEKSI